MAKRYRDLATLGAVLARRLERDPSATARTILGILEDSLSPTQKQTLKIVVRLADPDGAVAQPDLELVSRQVAEYGSQDSPSCPELDRLVSAQVWDLKAILAVLRQTIRTLPKGGSSGEVMAIELWRPRVTP